MRNANLTKAQSLLTQMMESMERQGTILEELKELNTRTKALVQSMNYDVD